MGTDFNRTRLLVERYEGQPEAEDRDHVIATLAQQGLTELEATAVLRQLYGVALLEGRTLLREHPSWQAAERSAKTLEELTTKESR